MQEIFQLRYTFRNILTAQDEDASQNGRIEWSGNFPYCKIRKRHQEQTQNCAELQHDKNRRSYNSIRLRQRNHTTSKCSCLQISCQHSLCFRTYRQAFRKGMYRRSRLDSRIKRSASAQGDANIILPRNLLSRDKFLESYLSQRRVNVKKEGAIDVPAAHFSEMSFVPTGKKENQSYLVILQAISQFVFEATHHIWSGWDTLYRRVAQARTKIVKNASHHGLSVLQRRNKFQWQN